MLMLKLELVKIVNSRDMLMWVGGVWTLTFVKTFVNK